MPSGNDGGNITEKSHWKNITEFIMARTPIHALGTLGACPGGGEGLGITKEIANSKKVLGHNFHTFGLKKA